MSKISPTKFVAATSTLLIGCAVNSYEFPEHFTITQRQSIQDWLMAHNEFKIATDQDCNCERELASYRNGGGVWPKNENYHPYYAAGDFNQDSNEDLAVVLINQKERSKRYLAVFNGPLKIGSKPVYLEPEELALFYGAPRPKPYKLIISEFNSEGASLEPRGNGYAINEESEY